MAAGESMGTWISIVAVGVSVFALLISYFAGRGSRPRGLEAHCEAVARQLADERFPESIRKAVLLETAVSLLVQQEIDRVSNLTCDDFLNEINILNVYKFSRPDQVVIEKIRGAFTKDNFGKLGEKVLDKVLGLANKAAGVALGIAGL